MALLKKISIINSALRNKLAIAFALMTVIPLLACFYVISPSIFPGLRIAVDPMIIVVLSLLISNLGFFIAKGIVDAVIDLADQARAIASGQLDHSIAVRTDDELGSLGQSINSMTQKIRSNLDELKGFGQSMKEINVEMHKKVLALSSLLQIGDIISAGSIQIDSLLQLAVEKASNLFDTGFGALYLPREEGGDLIAKTIYNIDKERLEEIVIRRDGIGVLEKALQMRAVTRIDASMKLPKEMDDFRRERNLKNALIVPLYSDRTTVGLMVIGNRLADFRYSSDDIGLVSVFSRHITIAIESDVLSKRNEELATRDELTGLFNKRFILARLEEEIKRAVFYQRPCSLILINIDNYRKFREERGELAAEEALKRVAKLVKDSTSPVGKTARVAGDEFAMLLPEKNKREAANIAEDVRGKIGMANVLKEGKATLTVSIGVSENPIDGATAEELYRKATDAVKEAKRAGKNKVIA